MYNATDVVFPGLGLIVISGFEWPCLNVLPVNARVLLIVYLYCIIHFNYPFLVFNRSTDIVHVKW